MADEAALKRRRERSPCQTGGHGPRHRRGYEGAGRRRRSRRRNGRKHDAALAEIAAETASVALQKLEVEHELAKLQLQKREADRTASLSTAALLERELGDELREALVTSAGLAALPPEFPGDEKEQGLELAMASALSSTDVTRATTPARDLDPERRRALHRIL